MLLARLLPYWRQRWPDTPSLVRSDRHWATPEVMDVIAHRRRTDVGFGFAGHPVWLRHAEPLRQAARHLPQPRTALAQAYGQRLPPRSRLYEECDEAAASWSRPWRVVLKAEVRSAGEHPRFVVTSLAAPPPQMRYEDLYGARGHGANASKAVQGALQSDRTSATTCLANAMRLLRACAASVLPHALRTHTLPHTALAHAQPSTVMLPLFKVATPIKQYKDRILLHLPSSCPVKALLHRVTALLSAVPLPLVHTS